MKEANILETKQSFSLRKLSVGLASVLIGISFLNGTKVNVVKADTKESSKENVQDVQTKNNEDMQSAILKNTSSQNADVHNTTQTDNTNLNKSVDSSTSAEQVGQVAGAERGDSSARETRTSQLNTNKTKPAVLTKLALNLGQTKNLNLQSLKESKIATNTTNGGFDEATWGKLDVTKWQGQAENGVYQLTGYTGDLEHIIVPNSADFATAGKDIGTLQVGIDADITHSWFEKGSPKTIAFSKTGDQKVKAVGTDWTSAFTGKSHELNKFDGNNLDVSNVTNMSNMFYNNKISDLNGIANWKTDNVTDMFSMFNSNQISDLSPLSNWKTDKVTDMAYMFQDNQISDLSPLFNWKTDNVTDMGNMFMADQISDLSPLANWDIDNVTDMSCMFYDNQISDLSPLTNWKTDNATSMHDMFENNKISDLSSLAKWKTDNVTNMAYMFQDNQISDLSPLINWKTDKVTDMRNMFYNNKISDLNGLANWNISNVTGMYAMFYNNKISDLSPLANWNISNVNDMSWMFYNNKISDLSPLANWDISNVTDMSRMFHNNRIKDLSPLANWNISSVTDMNGMFDYNQISDLSPLANWKTDKATDMSCMFESNKISNLSPLANWKTDNVTNMDQMFESNKISDLSSLANWKTDKVTDMAYMFRNNPIQYADFTKWNFDQVKYLANFINQTNYAIMLVKNAQDQAKLAGKSQISLYSSDLYPVVDTPSNNLHFGDTDTSSMPTILIATNKSEARQQLLSFINTKVSDYQKSHPDDTVTPAVLLDNLTELADLANAKFNVVPKVTIVTVHFIDDTDNLHAPKDYQLANQKMNAMLNSSNLKDDQDLANFKFTSEPAFTVTSLNPTWTVHLVHGLIEVTDPNQLQTISTRTIVFNLPNKTPETIVQTIGYKRTGMQDLITKQITYTNWVFDASRSNVTVDQQLSSLYAAYDPNSVSKDGTLVNFAQIKIPTEAGYKPVLQTAQPNMLLFAFMPIAKPSIEVKLDAPEKFSANDAAASLLPTWHLVENNMPNYTYTLTNAINSINLPKIKDYKLYLVNKDSQDNTVAFTYLKNNNLKYLFKIKFINNSFEFSVKNVDKDVISVYKFNNLKDLDKFLVEFVTAA